MSIVENMRLGLAGGMVRHRGTVHGDGFPITLWIRFRFSFCRLCAIIMANKNRWEGVLWRLPWSD